MELPVVLLTDMMFSDEEIDSLLKHQFEALKLYYKRN